MTPMRVTIIIIGPFLSETGPRSPSALPVIRRGPGQFSFWSRRRPRGDALAPVRNTTGSANGPAQLLRAPIRYGCPAAALP